MVATERGAPLRLIGLCAAWCGVCREFESAFRQVQSRYAATQQGFEAQWVDVEEPAISDALGEVDIQTFPTVAIGYGDQLLFWGEILPSEAVLGQLIERLDASHTSGVIAEDMQRAWKALCAQLWT